MAKTYNRMRIDVNEKINSICINPVQNDTQSRYLDVSLYDNGLPIDLTGEVVRINFKKEDGTTFFNQGEITNAAEGRCQFALTNEVLAEAKTLKAQISIWSGEGEILSTQVFLIYVTESIRNDEEVESTNEFGVLVVLFQEIQNSLDLMKAIAKNFGEPGEKAEEFGAETFWQMLEVLAGRVDAQGAIRVLTKEILNSTVDTDFFMSLDKMISSDAGTEDMIPLNEFIKNAVIGGEAIFREDGVFEVPPDVEEIRVIAAGAGGGGVYHTSSGYAGAAGGGGGACIDTLLNVNKLEPINIIIGKGGKTGTTSGSGKATAGGSTVFGDYFTLAGGKVGSNALTTNAESGGEGGGYGGGQGTNGEDGLYGEGGLSLATNGGGGGGGSYGKGGDGATSSTDAEDGVDGGGGGGGSKNIYGGNGGDGIVIIRWGMKKWNMQ